MKSSYELRLFRTSKDKDIAIALQIYTKNIQPIQRTDTNEILFWLDHYNKKFEGDKLYLFGFYSNNTLIGFTQFVYFCSHNILFFDYIVIDELHRKNNTFYELLEFIKCFLEDEGISYNYIIGEVGYLINKLEPNNESKSLIRLLKMAGFGVLKSLYYQPMLGKINTESQLPCILMVYTKSAIKELKKETFLSFIDTIYFRHYYRWYHDFFDSKEQADYMNNLNSLKHFILKSLEKKITIEINGYQHLYEKGAILNKKNNLKIFAKGAAVAILFSVFIVLFSLIHLVAKKYFNMDTSAQTNVFIGSFISVFLLIYVIREGKTESMTNLIENIIKKFL